MKAVLLVVNPKDCSLIASGKKTLIVRKNKPKLKTPFKCYIYCTLQGSTEFFKEELNGDIAKWNKGNWGNKKGKVIGEFVCATYIVDKTFGHDPLMYAAACMSATDVASYCTNKEMYGWHISNPVFYDTPKELNEFEKPYGTIIKAFDSRYIQKVPFNWCYVEELCC